MFVAEKVLLLLVISMTAYIVMSSPIGWAYTPNDPWDTIQLLIWEIINVSILSNGDNTEYAFANRII